MQIFAILPTSGDSAGIRIVGRAHRNGESAVVGDGDLGAGGGSGGDLAGGESTSDDEGGYGGPDNKLHDIKSLICNCL